MTASAAAPAVPPVTDRPVTLLVYRDDGPVERALGRRLGPRLPLPPLVLVLAGLAPLAVAIVRAGDGASSGLAAAVLAWLVLLGGASAGRPHEDRLRWMVPPLLRAGEYGAILWLAAIAGVGDTGAAFALLAVIAFRHYDLVYRLRHQSATPPAWLNRLCGGWAGRLAVAWLLVALGALPAGLVVLAVALGAVLVTESVASWTRFSRALRPAITYEDEEDEDVIGMVLAAGAGSRLGAETETLPKTLLPVDGERTILDVALGNFASVGLEAAVIVTGFASERIEERAAELEDRHGLRLELVFNPRALEWNNCYSLWCAREHFARGVLLANGDTVHPASVEATLLASRGGPELLIAVDDAEPLGEEEMKVHVTADGHLDRIDKALDPAGAHGEYIGVTLIEPAAAAPLADALEAVWRRDTTLYYEDGFQEFADRGNFVGIAPIGVVDWVEVDDAADLARAREVACRC